jgi:hypothetical protein
MNSVSLTKVMGRPVALSHMFSSFVGTAEVLPLFHFASPSLFIPRDPLVHGLESGNYQAHGIIRDE